MMRELVVSLSLHVLYSLPLGAREGLRVLIVALPEDI